MKQILSCGVFILFVTMLAAAQSPNGLTSQNAANRAVEQELKQLVETMEKGRLTREKTVAEQTLADSYISTGENGSNGGGKAQAVKGRSNPEANKRAAESLAASSFSSSIADVQVIPNGDTAVVNYRLTYNLNINGEAVVKVFRCNEVFIKRDGRWQSILHTETVIPGEPVRANVDAKIFRDYVGIYRLHSSREYTVTADAGQLYFEAPGVQKVELVPENANTFVQKGGLFYRIIFIRDDMGKVSQLRIKEFPGVEYSAIKIR